MNAKHQTAIEKATEWVVIAGDYERSKLDEFDSTGHDPQALGNELAIGCGANPERLAEFWTSRGLEPGEVSDPEFMALFVEASKLALGMVQAG